MARNINVRPEAIKLLEEKQEKRPMTLIKAMTKNMTTKIQETKTNIRNTF